MSAPAQGAQDRPNCLYRTTNLRIHHVLRLVTRGGYEPCCRPPRQDSLSVRFSGFPRQPVRLDEAHSLYYIDCVTPIERVTTFRIPDDLLQAMQALKERDGIPFSEQIRRALRMWLETKGLTSVAVERKRSRKRS
jgi:hypothetical protein